MRETIRDERDDRKFTSCYFAFTFLHRFRSLLISHFSFISSFFRAFDLIEIEIEIV